MPENSLNIDVSRYEALCRSTARMIADKVEKMDYDDICQRFRMRAWYAIGKYDGSRDRVGIDRFVFACIQNEKKDLLKRVKRNEALIEDLAPSGDAGYEFGVITRQEFENRYLQETAEQAFHSVEEELPFLPSTLSTLERQVVHFLYLAYDYGEISITLGIARKEVAPLVRAIREKMADWKPTSQAGDGAADPQRARVAERLLDDAISVAV